MKKRNLLRRGLMVLLSLVMVVTLLEPMAMMESSAAKVTQEQIDALKDSASALADKKKDIQAQLKEVRADKSQAQTQKNLIEDQIEVIQAEIDNIQSQIDHYDLLIDQKSEELANTQAREEKQYELFCQRIRTMEEEGQTSYWAILFSSNDFSDLLDNFMMVEEIIAYDNGVMDSLMALRQLIEAEKTELEDAKSQQEEARAAQETARREREAQEAEVDKLIKEIKSQETTLQNMEAELKKQAAAVDAEIKKKEKEMAAQIAKVASESGYMWPLPSGYNTLSSLFAGRKHPITGKYHTHTGIDVPAPKNTEIYAAKSGVVTTSVKQGSYGNYVVVSHSDGSSTLYAHMNKRAVSEGQTVKQGQVIGYVGTTGSSTGNHLHFEVRINGVRKNPTDYFKDKTLYVQANGKTQKLNH